MEGCENSEQKATTTTATTTADAAVPPRIDQSTGTHWKDTWVEILAGGPQRWKDGEGVENYAVAHQYLCERGVVNKSTASGSSSDKSSRVFVPLAGDCKFVPYVWGKGCSVVVNEQVGMAVTAMKQAFEGDKKAPSSPPSQEGENTEKKGTEFTSSVLKASDSPDDDLLWSSDDGRVSIWQTSIFSIPPGAFTVDCIFDKDAFGAIQPKDRAAYVTLMKTLLKPGGHVLLEVKNRSDGVGSPPHGPPFHFDREIVAQAWSGFTIVDYVAQFYPLKNPNWQQQAFLLRFD